MAGVQEVHAAPPASTISQPLARHPESAADARARTATAALSAPSSDDFQSDEEDDDDGASFASVIGSVMDAPDAVGEVASDAANNITDEVREAAGSLASDATRPAGEGIDTLGGVAADALDGIGLDDQAASVRKSTSDYGGIIREMGDTAQDLASSENRVMVPDGSAAPPHALSPDGRLRVVSWNLHHGEGPNDNGTPPQMDAMLERMRAARGDVYLLQEVPPDQAQHIADATGMRGYFTRTTPQQGNMILVHPDRDIPQRETAGQHRSPRWGR